MPYLQVNDKQVLLRPGETRIGVGGQVEVRLPGPTKGPGPLLAIVELSRDNHVAVRRAVPGAVVRVNGVQLGAEPTPLLHGDKIDVGGTEIYYGDDRKGGSTQFVPSANVPDMARLRAPGPVRATAVTGGRVISLVDGREYPVDATGLVFGRDASCDVVIASSEVSRRHAEIVPGDAGYVVTDSSTNGLFVNGERVEGMQILGRADILRIGPEEFRFYADSATPEAAVAQAVRAGLTSAASAPPAQAQAEPSVSAPTAGDSATSIPTPQQTPSLALRGALATLEVTSGGLLKGEVYPVKAVLAHLGRGEHNDVVIPEESVSDSHAKLQRRDGVWYITDVGSTNGTYVAGRRIVAEERLDPGADLRLGGVKLVFKVSATEPATGPRGATREMTDPGGMGAPRRSSGAAAAAMPSEGPSAAAPRPGAPRPPRREPPPPGRGGYTPQAPAGGRSRWGWIILVVAAIAAVAAYFIKVR